MTRLAWITLVLCACGPATSGDADTSSGGGSSSTASSGAIATEPGIAPTSTGAPATSTAPPTTGTSAADDSSGFLLDPCSECGADEICVQGDGGDSPPPPECVPADGCVPADPCPPACAALCGDFAVCEATGPHALACLDPHACDLSSSPFYACNDGEKCTPSDPLQHGWYSGTSCVPVAGDPQPPGAPCTSQGGPHSGADDCEAGALCWGVDPGTLTGTCIELCTTDGDATCDTPGAVCSQLAPDLPVCAQPCHPLVQDCAVDEVCVPFATGSTCLPDASGPAGQYHDPCTAPNACDPGFLCTNPAFVPDCASACCSPFCDLTADDPCPGMPTLSCIPLYNPGDAPPGDENLGACAVMP